MSAGESQSQPGQMEGSRGQQTGAAATWILHMVLGRPLFYQVLGYDSGVHSQTYAS